MTEEDQAPGIEQGFFAALLDDDPVELYEQAPCAYVSLAPGGAVLKVNQTFVRWTGYGREELVGVLRIQDLLHAGSRIYFETHVAPMLRMQGEVREIAADLRTADGGRLPVFLSATTRRGADGAVHAIRLALFDARERRAYEQELVAERRRAEAAEARARALAETLQASFLPPAVLEVPGLDIAGAYRPAGDGREVGGDFYDVFETGRGTWGVVLGDVCGKGASAATLTALARYTVRAEALRTPYPSAVLSSVHDALRRNHPDRFCTALFLVLDRYEGHFRATVSSGGHHLPILVREGTVARLGSTGTIIGMLDQVVLTDVTTALLPGDTVVLYTDGVTEARREGEFLDDEGLEALLLDLPPLDAAGVADAVVEAAVRYQAGVPRDDIAVVALRVPDGVS